MAQAMSYVSGISDTPLLGKTIGQALDDAAAIWAERPALIDRGTGTRWTWKQLRDEADAFAAGLLALGLKPGERIGIWSLNRAEWTLTQFAAAKAGLILVTINPAYRLTELEYALNLVGCSALVTATQFKTSDYIGMLNTLAPELSTAKPGALKAAKLPSLRIVIQIAGNASGTIPFTEVAKRGSDVQRAELKRLAETLQFDDPINIQFTSGTTGNPKGVTLTHHNILNNGYFVGKGCALTPEDKICIPVPLYHCFGMVMGNLAAVTNGSAMVYPGEGFDPLATLEAISGEGCTTIYGVPTMFIAQLEHARFKDLNMASLRTGIMAGSPCPIELMKKVIALMNLGEMTICYGMTETSPVSFQSAVDDPIERRVSTIGRVHPHVEV
jgi:fatty-acyl-CoA synthase